MICGRISASKYLFQCHFTVLYTLSLDLRSKDTVGLIFSYTGQRNFVSAGQITEKINFSRGSVILLIPELCSAHSTDVDPLWGQHRHDAAIPRQQEVRTSASLSRCLSSRRRRKRPRPKVCRVRMCRTRIFVNRMFHKVAAP